MKSPCQPCEPLSCYWGPRKEDCLKHYPNLRRIGNSPGGFKEANENPENWPEYERTYYYKMIERYPMARKSTKKVNTQAENLANALKFIKVGTATFDDWQKYCVLTNKMALATNGQITAGHPIEEELNLCPQLEKLLAAINRCGSSLAITETPGGQLSIKGEKLKAIVQCVGTNEIPRVDPDANQYPCDDRVKDAFRVCGLAASEAAERVVEASLQLETEVCSGTNGHVIIQYRHMNNFPPNIVLPKVFTEAVQKTTQKLIGFGFSWSPQQTDGSAYVQSLTFWFEGGSWIKTQCYIDRWPDLNPIINVNSSPAAVIGGLFEGVEAVSHFNENQYITFGNEMVMSHDSAHLGAQYEVKGLQAGKKFDGKLLKMIAPYVKTIDITTYHDRAFWFGDNIRGVVICRISENLAPEPEPEIDESQQAWGTQTSGMFDSETGMG